MKILWLFKYTSNWNFNHWFHMDFAYKIAERPNVELKSYGFSMTRGFPKLDLIPYNDKILMQDLKKEFNFDIIILDGKARMYKTPQGNIWLPKDFDNFDKVPKILIEGDYHNNKDLNWYSNRGIDMILQRHFRNTEKAKKQLPEIKNIWFPCSVDTEIFKSDSKIQRENKICFVGGHGVDIPAYFYRTKAIKILMTVDLIKKYKKRIEGQKYIKCLQSYVSHLNGSSIYNINTAKMFEIMACGSVLLTDYCPESGIQYLFPKNSYVTYKRDFSNLTSMANKILHDISYRNYINKRAIKTINKKHTHSIRVKEFLQILEKYYGLC